MTTSKLRHGAARRGQMTREYRSWSSMIVRCTNPRYQHWSRYGGRGITVCERWRTFENFLADMGLRPPGTTLDRRDNDSGYEPGNCRWATKKEQSENTRQNRLLTVQGETLSLGAWARRAGVRHQLISRRLADGWPPERAVLAPARAISRQAGS